MRKSVLAVLLLGLVALAVTIYRGRSEPGPLDGIAERTGCIGVESATAEEFAEFVGPVRAKLYLPVVAEWGTCAKPPYERLGLVVLRPGAVQAIGDAWRTALARGEVRGDPDLAFGDDFALTGSIGMEGLGLRHLRCTATTCEFAPAHHHH